eukprot:TRINITY_DN11417_c0_g1_i2.p1 TRINITY_DN11417_c0_g1~~TRINITY_DN11417_c0_g1_i2.p1  ORF type:complete len:939 (-),score=70.40 TRINITY_DN11417_c0_g1_i2:18-2834(-)
MSNTPNDSAYVSSLDSTPNDIREGELRGALIENNALQAFLRREMAEPPPLFRKFPTRTLPTPQTGVTGVSICSRLPIPRPAMPQTVDTPLEPLLPPMEPAEPPGLLSPRQKTFEPRIVFDGTPAIDLSGIAEEYPLCFESRFESGNLQRAIQINHREYDLYLRFDVGTKRHTQWFYFSFTHALPGTSYKFNIVNMCKPHSLYSQGMQPLLYSMRDAELHGSGWRRTGFDITYTRSAHFRGRGKPFYTLSWKFTLVHDQDLCFFAYCYPYTYTDLQKYLRQIEADAERNRFFRRRPLCQTAAGNSCDVLTITSFACDKSELDERKGVVICARCHPGETNSSWVMQGVIDFLTAPTPEARYLRDHFIFKIIPMVNPDGVVVGNYRCSLSGEDLNRRWAAPDERYHPEVVAIKRVMTKFQQEREVVMFLDLHGHSRKKNFFVYGCGGPPGKSIRQQAGLIEDDEDIAARHCYLTARYPQRVFPRLLWRLTDAFSFDDCNFHIQHAKLGTARVVMYQEYGVLQSYTLESSFCGPSYGPLLGYQFNSYHFLQMGRSICLALVELFNPERTQVQTVLAELEQLQFNDDNSSQGSNSSDSDSEKSRKPRPNRRRALVAWRDERHTPPAGGSTRKPPTPGPKQRGAHTGQGTISRPKTAPNSVSGTSSGLSSTEESRRRRPLRYWTCAPTSMASAAAVLVSQNLKPAPKTTGSDSKPPLQMIPMNSAPESPGQKKMVEMPSNSETSESAGEGCDTEDVDDVDTQLGCPFQSTLPLPTQDNTDGRTQCQQPPVTPAVPSLLVDLLTQLTRPGAGSPRAATAPGVDRCGGGRATGLHRTHTVPPSSRSPLASKAATRFYSHLIGGAQQSERPATVLSISYQNPSNPERRRRLEKDSETLKSNSHTTSTSNKRLQRDKISGQQPLTPNATVVDLTGTLTFAPLPLLPRS